MAKRKTDVVKPNSIAESRGMMSKAYLDILDISLHIIARGNDEPKKLEYDIRVIDYADKFGIEPKNAYRLFKKYRTEIKNSNKSVRMDVNGIDSDVWIFQNIGYDDGNGTVKIKFTEDFKAYLVQKLEERGKKIYYGITDTLQMKSVYSKKFYPILLERTHKKIDDRMKFSAEGSLKGKYFDRIDTIENFRSLLSMPDSYGTKSVKDFCKTIEEEVKAFTPFVAKAYFNEIGSRSRYKKITHICWTIEEVKEQPVTDQGKPEPVQEPELITLGTYQNVTFTPEQFETLKAEFPSNWEAWVNTVSKYLETSGREPYNNNLAVIRDWSEKQKQKEEQSMKEKHKELHGFEPHDYDFQKLEQQLLDY